MYLHLDCMNLSSVLDTDPKKGYSSGNLDVMDVRLWLTLTDMNIALNHLTSQ